MQNALIMPVLYYPTQVVLVDDNPNFVEVLQQGIAKAGITSTVFMNPMEALRSLSLLELESPFLKALHFDELSHSDELAFSEQTLLAAIHTLAENPKRHEAVTVVVADYDMPELPGDIFFSTFSHPYIKKIMLTGYADYEMAVKFFNERVFHQFLVKEVFTTTEQLALHIGALQQRYFTEMCSPIVNTLFVDHPYVLQSDYAQWVQALLEHYHIREHYTVAKNGSKCLRDHHGNVRYLAIATSEEMDGFVQTAELADAPESLLKPLRERTCAPVLFTSEALQAVPAEWALYLHPVQKVTLNGCDVFWVIV
jgi:CheY-like chemotaxis protein